MARDIDLIQKGIIADVQATPELQQEASNNSKRAKWRLWTRIQATAILVLEQIIDFFKEEIEVKISKATPGTAEWFTDKIYSFQYSATNPQVIQLINFAPQYPIVNKDLQIISRCSVITALSNQVTIKVAKQNPPVALTNLELAALQSFVDKIGVQGVDYNCNSSNSDKIYINADIFYTGQYASVIKNNVKEAINIFLSKIPFDGKFKVLDLELAIKNVLGVQDVLIKNLKVRPDNLIFLNGLYLVQNKTTISRLINLLSGYVVEETTVGFTFDDSLNFIAQ
jgi:hypothetical protein